MCNPSSLHANFTEEMRQTNWIKSKNTFVSSEMTRAADYGSRGRMIRPRGVEKKKKYQNHFVAIFAGRNNNSNKECNDS